MYLGWSIILNNYTVSLNQFHRHRVVAIEPFVSFLGDVSALEALLELCFGGQVVKVA